MKVPGGAGPGSAGVREGTLLGRALAAWKRLTPFRLDWMQVELSARCQGRCPYCPVEVFRDSRGNGFMTRETFQALLPAFSSADLIYLQGWGEPLVHPHFWDMARRAVGTGAAVGFTTNGLLLDRENRRALLDSGVKILGVTLAGATPEIHERYRPGSPLAALDEYLLRLKEEGEGRGAAGPALHIALQLLAGNVEEVEGMVDLAGKWGAREIVVSPLSLILTREMEKESLHRNPAARADAAAALERAGEKARSHGISFHAYRITEPAREPACRENILRSCFVSAGGDVSPCVMTNVGLDPGAMGAHRFQGKDHPLTPLTFGNARERPLEEIWRSEPARAFRDGFRTRIYQGARGKEGLPSSCRQCYKLFEA